MKWPLTVLLLIIGVGVAAWFVFLRERPSPGSWAMTEGGCYLPVGQPDTASPGPVCGSLQALQYCEWQGQLYAPGERFAALDACNSCTCDPGTRMVRCTEKACGEEASSEKE